MIMEEITKEKYYRLFDEYGVHKSRTFGSIDVYIFEEYSLRRDRSEESIKYYVTYN